jgi:hypothetical protein
VGDPERLADPITDQGRDEAREDRGQPLRPAGEEFDREDDARQGGAEDGAETAGNAAGQDSSPQVWGEPHSGREGVGEAASHLDRGPFAPCGAAEQVGHDRRRDDRGGHRPGDRVVPIAAHPRVVVIAAHLRVVAIAAHPRVVVIAAHPREDQRRPARDFAAITVIEPADQQACQREAKQEPGVGFAEGGRRIEAMQKDRRPDPRGDADNDRRGDGDNDRRGDADNDRQQQRSDEAR